MNILSGGNSKDHTMATIFGESLLLSSIQVALASVEMSSRFSVLNFSKDAETLQNAANALTSYVVVGSLFTLGAVLNLYASFGLQGGIICGLVNISVMLWIVISYRGAFKKAALKYSLQEPEMFKTLW